MYFNINLKIIKYVKETATKYSSVRNYLKYSAE